jgi:hypothetical protein
LQPAAQPAYTRWIDTFFSICAVETSFNNQS